MAEAAPAAIAGQLLVEERLMLFCVASGTIGAAQGSAARSLAT